MTAGHETMECQPVVTTAADRAAWWASLTEDERLLAWLPPGYRVPLILIAQTKRIVMGEIPPVERLELLEKMMSLANGILTPAVLAQVEPAGDVETKMFAEARGNYDALQAWDVFLQFTRANPSIIAAVRMCSATLPAAA
jgi:hypothetical protein